MIDYALGAALCLLLVFGWQRAWRWAGIAALIVGLAGAQVASSPRVAPVARPSAERSVRLLVYNLYRLNPDLDAVVATVQRYDPDIVFLRVCEKRITIASMWARSIECVANRISRRASHRPISSVRMALAKPMKIVSTFR